MYFILFPRAGKEASTKWTFTDSAQHKSLYNKVYQNYIVHVLM